MKRLLTIAGVVVGVLILGLLAAPLFINIDSFRPDLEKKVSAALNRPVTIGKLEASIFSGGASAENITIADDPAFNKGPFLQASSLKVGLRLLPLIFSRQLSVTSITVEKPEIVILRNAEGKWNYSSFGASTAEPSEPATSSSAPNFSVDTVEIVDGSVSIGQGGARGAGKERNYQSLHLIAHDISFSSAMPFTLTASTPGGGSLQVNGTAGPLDRQDSARTPLDAQVALEHLDLGATGLLDGSSGLAGKLDFDGKIHSDGHKMHAEGKGSGAGLILVKGGAPARAPVSFDYTGDYSLELNTGSITANVHTGKSTATATGTVDTHTQDVIAHLRLQGKDMAMNDIAALFPALGLVLPSGASIQGGVANVEMTAEGPIDRLVITGPITISNTHLIGYNLTAKLGALAALTGFKPSDDTLIQTAASGLRVAPEGLHADNIVIDVPSIGSLSGSGAINSSNVMDFQMVMKLSGTAGNLLGSVGTLVSASKTQGIPFVIQGKTSSPEFRPSFGGGKGSLANTLLGGGKDGGQPGGLGGLLGGFGKKKKPQQ
ncbi:MAG TPA: AsmA family protein [Terriglobales bacterium]